MGPKKADSTGKGSKLSQGVISAMGTMSVTTISEQDTQQCIGKFAADLELCCREPSSAYPIAVPVYIRGHPPVSARIQLVSTQNQQQQPPVQVQQLQSMAALSGTSATPSVTGVNVEEPVPLLAKKTSRARAPSSALNAAPVATTGIDNENRSLSVAGQEQPKILIEPYKTFHLIQDSEFYRPKLLADSTNSETEPIDQITALYMRSWKLDQRLIDILKRVLPLQEQLNTLDLCFVGLNERTIYGVADLCQITKNLKTVSLDGNTQAADYFHLLIEKDESKVMQLSLRFCEIADAAAEKIAHALGNISKQNWKLLTLNLSGNRIGDNGAKAFATALRYNRTLISLNLSSNFVTDVGAIPLALVLRKIRLTPEEILRRRYIILKRYVETHPDEFRVFTSSPTPSNVSAKSKSGRSSRNEWKRATDSKKKFPNVSKTVQNVSEKRIRNESDENRPPSENRNDSKRGRSDGSGGRASIMNLSSATGSTSRRSTASLSTTNTKESDQSRATGPSRIKKVATTVNAAAKKNITIVKEEDEDATQQQETLDDLSLILDFVGRQSDLSLSGKSSSLPFQQADRENPLFETNEGELHGGEIWLKGNLVLLSLNLSRNYLTMDSLQEFLLSVQHQSTLIDSNDALNPSSASTAVSFYGLCRLELKGMNDISTKSPEYHSLVALLAQKSPSYRFQQFRERETKDSFDTQAIQPSQQLQQSISEKAANVSEKTRIGSSTKASSQRPTSRLKD